MGNLRLWLYVAILSVTFKNVSPTTDGESRRHGVEDPLPRVMVGVIAMNTARTLPNVFGYLEALDYPKERIIVWYVLWGKLTFFNQS